ncbi:hypothetical protein TWF281_006180 [Arthrobotrys megalospora]
MLSKRIILLCLPLVALVATQDTTVAQGGDEQDLNARELIELSTAFSDYEDTGTQLFTDPNGGRKPTPTTLETLTRPAAEPESTPVAETITPPPKEEPEPTPTVVSPPKLDPGPAPDYLVPGQVGPELSVMGQHILLYGTYSEDDMKGLNAVIEQAGSIYTSNSTRCQARYRTSKYLPGADVSGYLESRILACENGYSLRLGNHAIGNLMSERCYLMGITYSGKIQQGIQEGKGHQITGHFVENDMYKLIASTYKRRMTTDVRFGFEKKGCPPKDGTDEQKAEYVKVYTEEEWRSYVMENPKDFDYGLLEFKLPPMHSPTMGIPQPMANTAAPLLAPKPRAAPPETEARGTISATDGSKDVPSPTLPPASRTPAPVAKAQAQATRLAVEAPSGSGSGSEKLYPNPDPEAPLDPDPEPPLPLEGIDEPMPTGTDPDDPRFDKEDPKFWDPPAKTIDYIPE